MNYLIAAVLGAIQGFTEFVPISSDGHLFLVRQILNWPDQGLAFDAVMHFGTLVAIILVLHRELWYLLKGVINIIKTGKIWKEPQQQFVTTVVIASIPAVLAGVFLDKIFSDLYRNILSVGLWFMATGAFYFLTEVLITKSLKKEQPSALGALWIGLAQVFSLLPGVSRSGTTIATGMLVGLKRQAAAKFSFVMATPILIGASGLSLYRLFSENSKEIVSWGPLSLATLVAFIVGLIALKSLLKLLKKRSLKIFGSYLLILGGIIVLLHVLRIW